MLLIPCQSQPIIGVCKIGYVEEGRQRFTLSVLSCDVARAAGYGLWKLALPEEEEEEEEKAL